MIEKRGRPKETVIEPSPRKFTKVYEDEDMIETWTYNLDIHRGPISVDIKYKTGAEKAIKLRAKDAKQEKRTARQMKKINTKQLPLSQQQWLNPANGKMVGYTRAKALNLIK
jgi:transcriptional accessory protein Tex/SPT6